MSLEILLQIAMLHVLRYDAWSRLATVMTADHHAQQPYHVSIVQTTKHRHFTLKVEPTTTTTLLTTREAAWCIILVVSVCLSDDNFQKP